MRINTNQFNIDFKSESLPTDKITAGEFFAGGGGWTSGMEKISDIETRWILNHDKVAIQTNAFHHRGVKVYWADLYVQDEHEMEQVDYIHASIECDQHSRANAGKEKKIGSYTMGWEFFRYLKYLLPLVISIENVPEFKKWAPLDAEGNPDKSRLGEEFERWKMAIKNLGYEYRESIRNAADDGLPTKRVRLFCFFYRTGIDITFPDYTHSESGENGKQPWNSCREHIDTENHGVSIFGREFNMDLPKHLRRPLCKNSLKRIAGGIKKQHPDFHQFLCKYHSGVNPERSYSLDEPIRVIDGSNRHQLITIENGQFIQDHCRTDNYQKIDEPLRAQLTWQTKQLVTMEKLQFIMDHCHSDSYQDLSDPLNVQTTRQTKQIATIEFDDSFLVQHYGNSVQSNSLDEPIYTIPCRDVHQLLRLEKRQFIAKYFNSNGNPGANTESIDGPLSAVMTEPKHQLITILEDFDIKARFLSADELASCSTFPKYYFSHPDLMLSQKKAIQLIGNAVPPEWATKLVAPNVNSIQSYKLNKMIA